MTNQDYASLNYELLNQIANQQKKRAKQNEIRNHIRTIDTFGIECQTFAISGGFQASFFDGSSFHASTVSPTRKSAIEKLIRKVKKSEISKNW